MKRRAPTSSRGFTLLELLIGLAVTALVVGLVFSGFGMIGRSEERNQAWIDRAERMLLVSQWLGRKFDGLRPLTRIENGKLSYFFSGTEAGALWIAPLPERGEGGGLHVLRLGPLRHPGGAVDLSVEALPFGGANMSLDWNTAIRQTLLTNVRSLRWSYQDPSGQWVNEWGRNRAGYPARVRIQIGDDRGDWPPLVFALPGAR